MLNELPKLEVNIGVSIDALYAKHDSISKKKVLLLKLWKHKNPHRNEKNIKIYQLNFIQF